MIDFASFDVLPCHAFPTTLDPNNFGTRQTHGKQWHLFSVLLQGRH